MLQKVSQKVTILCDLVQPIRKGLDEDDTKCANNILGVPNVSDIWKVIASKYMVDEPILIVAHRNYCWIVKHWDNCHKY